MRLSNWLVCLCSASLGQKFSPGLEGIEEEKEDGDVWECDEESNLEENVAESHQSCESLYSESLTDSVDTSVLDSFGSFITGHDQETNSANGQVKKSKLYTNTGTGCSVTAVEGSMSIQCGGHL